MQKIQSYPSNINTHFKKCHYYFGGLILLLVIAAVFLSATGKAASFLSLNSYHPFALNVFFINYTFLGDGIFAICIILFCFYRKKSQSAIALLLSFLVSGLIVQIIKNLVSAPRPKLFFEEGQYLFFIDGVSHGGHSSFPSGHTATAFAIATILVLLIRDKKWQLPILIAAALVGYSRIYLAQHFLIDVIIGSLIGCLSGITAIYLVTAIKKFPLTYRKFQSKETDSAEQVPAPVQAA
jgi:membrane-associated phospholipid phosphatase